MSHSTIGWLTEISEGLIQASTVKPLPAPTSKLLEAGTSTSASVPLKLNAWPTSPRANINPPCGTPLFTPRLSYVLVSAAHQLTKPVGGVSHTSDPLTVSMALELDIELRELLTSTE